MSESAPELYSTKADYAYLRVKELILSGTLPPASVIAQVRLARDIGISTTPLRERLGGARHAQVGRHGQRPPARLLHLLRDRP